jgi:hypothetical protein
LYNVGAAITVLAIEFWLLRRFGIRKSILVVAALNGFTGTSLRLFMADIAAAPPPPSERARFASTEVLALRHRRGGLRHFQLVMIKVAECFLGPFRETFALVLSIVLLGIAFGTLWTMRWRVAFGNVMLTGNVGTPLDTALVSNRSENLCHALRVRRHRPVHARPPQVRGVGRHHGDSCHGLRRDRAGIAAG